MTPALERSRNVSISAQVERCRSKAEGLQVLDGARRIPAPPKRNMQGFPPRQPSQPGAQGVSSRPTSRGNALRPRLGRSEEHTSELQSLTNLVCRLLLEKKKTLLDGGHYPWRTRRGPASIPPVTVVVPQRGRT